LIYEKFRSQIAEFEEILQKLATEIASGIIFERLQPMEIWKKTENSTNRLIELNESLKDMMLMLKPEKEPTINKYYLNMAQTLKNFKEILFQKSPEPLANSRLAFEQLRKAVTDGSDYLILMREIRDNPSPIIDTILRLREAAQTKGPVITIQASEDLQPILNRIFQRIEKLRASLLMAEKALAEVKHQIKLLEEESLHFSTEKKALEKSKQNYEPKKEEKEKKQLSLSQFRSKGE